MSNQIKVPQVRVPVSRVLAVVSLIAVAVGCKDSNTITGNNSGVPTPSASDARLIAGSWSGTWDSWTPTSNCQAVPATANFTTVDGAVTGTLRSTGTLHPSIGSSCKWGLDFQGSIRGGHLTGIARDDALEISGSVQGALSDSGTTLELKVYGFNRFGHAWPGSMHFHR